MPSEVTGVLAEPLDNWTDGYEMAPVVAAMRQAVQAGQRLTTAELARTACYSQWHFHRLFQRRTGTTPGRYLTGLRYQLARELLAGTDLTVAQVAERVGYSSVGTFITRFKRHVGVTPGRYRRQAARNGGAS